MGKACGQVEDDMVRTGREACMEAHGLRGWDTLAVDGGAQSGKAAFELCEDQFQE